MASPIHKEKIVALLIAALGIGLLFLGAKIPGPPRIFLVLLGAWMAAHFTRRFALLQRAEERIAESWGRGPFDELRRASLPRQLFALLYAVAEVDGSPGLAERELVRRFLTERFRDPLSRADLESYEAARIPPEQALALAFDLRRSLGASERDTVFSWCCLVAFADGRFAREEHVVLQSIARGLGLSAERARRVFLHAKSIALANGGGPRWRRTAGERAENRARARGVVGDRAEALAVLGLPQDATPEQIRTRHRELVKEHHPDAHAHLGPVAAEEATERFREIQAAYEVLTR